MAVVAAVVVVCLNWSWVQARWRPAPAAANAPAVAASQKPQVELLPDREDALRIPSDLLQSKRFGTVPVAATPEPAPLQLQGTIVLDPNRHVRVHSLFSGQVVKMGLQGNMTKTSERLSSVPDNGLRVSDTVKKGQILAVVWSRDAGGLKTDLVNQLSKLRADRNILDRYKSVPAGVLTQTQLTQAQQQYETDVVGVRNAERNLRSAQFTEEEIAAVTAEAAKLQEVDAPRDLELERTWAEVPVRAPFDGLIVEKNVTVGDTVDTAADMFKLAKLDRLQVMANVYEEDLAKLQQIAKEAEEAEAAVTSSAGLPRTGESPGLEAMVHSVGDHVRAWTVDYQATGETGEPGSFDKIGAVIDPMQHTGTVTGWVDNSQRKLFVGQFVTVTVRMKPDRNLAAVPASAVVESPDGPLAFFQEKEPGTFVRRKVAVAVRGRDQMFLRLMPGPEEARRGASAIAPGDVVLARGAVELNGELETLKSEAKK